MTLNFTHDHRREENCVSPLLVQLSETIIAIKTDMLSKYFYIKSSIEEDHSLTKLFCRITQHHENNNPYINILIFILNPFKIFLKHFAFIAPLWQLSITKNQKGKGCSVDNV